MRQYSWESKRVSPTAIVGIDVYVITANNHDDKCNEFIKVVSTRDEAEQTCRELMDRDAQEMKTQDRETVPFDMNQDNVPEGFIGFNDLLIKDNGDVRPRDRRLVIIFKNGTDYSVWVEPIDQTWGFPTRERAIECANHYIARQCSFKDSVLATASLGQWTNQK